MPYPLSQMRGAADARIATLRRDIVPALKRFLLPNQCVTCHRMVEADRPDEITCKVCLSRLQGVAVGCETCAQPLPPVGPCRVCAGWPARLRCRSAVWLDGEARAMVHWLKYRGFTGIGAVAAREILRRMPLEADLLIPVPLGKRRFARRGYNQSAYIARALGLLAGIPVADNVLVRTRETRSQTELTPLERAANVSGAFVVVRSAASVAAQTGCSVNRVALVDDVFTTGATMVAAGTALFDAGFGELDGITFARARTFADVVANEINK